MLQQPRTNAGALLNLIACAVAALVLLFGVLWSDASAARRFRVGGDPADITYGPGNAFWFTESFGNKIGRITQSGALRRYRLPKDSDPTGIVEGTDHRVWFTTCCSLGRLSASGKLRFFDMPLSSGVLLGGITAGPDGAIWFTESTPAIIGRMTTNGELTQFALPHPRNHMLSGITTGPDHALWFGDAGRVDRKFRTHNPQAIWRVTTSGAFTRYGLSHNSDPQSFGRGGGAVWVTDPPRGDVLRVWMDGSRRRFHVSTPYSDVESIVPGPGSAMWFASGPAGIGRIDFDGKVRTFDTGDDWPGGLAVSPANDIWYTDMGGVVGEFVPPARPASERAAASRGSASARRRSRLLARLRQYRRTARRPRTAP